MQVLPAAPAGSGLGVPQVICIQVGAGDRGPGHPEAGPGRGPGRTTPGDAPWHVRSTRAGQQRAAELQRRGSPEAWPRPPPFPPQLQRRPAQPGARCPSLELSPLPSLQRVSSSCSLPGSQACAGNVLWRALPPLGVTCHCFSWSAGRQGTGVVAVMCLGRQ